MRAVTTREQALLQSLWQRPRLYVAPFHDFRLKVKTVKKDATDERIYRPRDWRPVLNIGPHRLAFVGETVEFDAKDSFKVTFQADGKHRRAHAQGFGKGHGLGLLDWEIKDDHWKAKARDWNEVQRWTPTKAGLYELTCESVDRRHERDREHEERRRGKHKDDHAKHMQDDEAVARRWIRVYESRDEAHFDVTAIEGLGGAWGEGWSCTLTLQSTSIGLEEIPIKDYQAIGIFAEEDWFDANGDASTDLRQYGSSQYGYARNLSTSGSGGGWTTRAIGAIRQDPRVVMIGYVKEGSVQINAETRTVTLTLESVTGQMDRSMSHKVAIWNADGPDDDKDKDGNEIDQPRTRHDREKDDPKHRHRRTHGLHKQRMQARREEHGKGNGKDGADNWGSVLRGFRRVCVSDFALWYLMFKTNLLKYHDFYAAWDSEMADLESIAGEETSVLSNLVTVGENDWVVTGADAGNAIYFAPDRQVLTNKAWELEWPTRMVLGKKDIWELKLTQQTEDPVKFVKLIATKTADFQSDAKRRRKQRREERRNQIEESFPSKNPPRDEPGTWFVRSDLLHDNARVIRQRAERVFLVQNLTWTGSITMGVNRALAPGYVIELDNEVGNELLGRKGRSFLVKAWSADIDIANRTWKTAIDVEEWLGTYRYSGKIEINAKGTMKVKGTVL